MCHLVDGLAGQHPNDWVASGDWVISTEGHRVPTGWNLQGAAQRSLGSQLTVVGPLQWSSCLKIHTDPVGVRRDPEILVKQLGGICEPILARPKHHLEDLACLRHELSG